MAKSLSLLPHSHRKPGCLTAQADSARLPTNLRTRTLEEIAELIDCYRCKWEVEIFFDALKNGCKLEARQLLSIERLEPAQALFMSSAWRV
jgi:hypothetical protein